MNVAAVVASKEKTPRQEKDEKETEGKERKRKVIAAGTGKGRGNSNSNDQLLACPTCSVIVRGKQHLDVHQLAHKKRRSLH